MKETPANIPASILARLKNLAQKENLDFNFLLLRYIQERFLSRLAASRYVNNFVLKGGLLLLAYNIGRARPTRDIDFQGIDISSDRTDLELFVKDIVSVDLGDGVSFRPESIQSAVIKENAAYEGVRIKLTAKIGSARNVIQLDFAFGDAVSSHPLEMDYPTLLSEEGVRILAYSKETIVAEKFEAIVKLASFNSRMKDFHDLSFLLSEFDFDGRTLQTAIRTTFQHRNTSIRSAVELLNSDLGSAPGFQRQWDAFKKKTRLSGARDFKGVFDDIGSFLAPVLMTELEGRPMNRFWRRADRKWE